MVLCTTKQLRRKGRTQSFTPPNPHSLLERGGVFNPVKGNPNGERRYIHKPLISFPYYRSHIFFTAFGV